MSSNTKELSAKLAALAKAREEKEARHKREEEQERLEEELLQKELKRVEAEEKKREAEEWKRRKAEEEQRKKDEAKVALVAAEARKRAEAEKAETGKKRKDMEGSGEGTGMMEDGVMWYTQSDAVCEPCEKSGEVCLWRDSAWARACRACHNSKRECPVPDTRPDTRKGGVRKDGLEAGTEAGPSKKRKVAPKGKGKRKELPALELGEDVGMVLLTEIRGLRDDFRALGEVGKAILRLLDATKNDVEYIAGVVEKREMDNTGVEVEGVEGTGGGEEMEEVEGTEKGEGAEGLGGAGVEGNTGSEIEVEGTLV
jgi:hypothetical protein